MMEMSRLLEQRNIVPSAPDPNRSSQTTETCADDGDVKAWSSHCVAVCHGRSVSGLLGSAVEVR